MERSNDFEGACNGGGKKPIYMIVYELRAKGYDYATIAKIVYGSDDERAQSKARRMMVYARERLARLLEQLEQSSAYEEVAQAERAVREGRGFVSEKKRMGGVARQWMEHQMLMHNILERLGFPPRSPLWAEMNWWHAKLFPLLVEEYGLRLRCWRNGRSKRYPFSCTPDSVAYVHALLSSLLLSRGYMHKRGELDAMLNALVNPESVRKAMLLSYPRVAGIVFSIFFGPRPWPQPPAGAPGAPEGPGLEAQARRAPSS